jgi:tetratricopeptide (TPR) repeat protein
MENEVRLRRTFLFCMFGKIARTNNMTKHLFIISVLICFNTICRSQSADSLFDAATERMQKENYKAAIGLWNKLEKIEPGMVNLYINRANCEYALEDYKAAIKDYSIMVAIDSSDYESYLLRSFCYTALHQTDSAMADLRLAEFYTKDDARPAGSLGFHFWQIQQYDSAIVHLSRALAFNRGDMDALFYRAQSYYSKERYEDAIKDYSYILQIDNSYPQQQYLVYNNRALCYEKLNKTDEALKDYETLLKKKPNSAVAFSNRGLLKIKMKDTAGACEDFAKAKDEENLKKYCKK